MFFLKLVWEKWKLTARKIGLFQSRVILTIFYFTLLLPAGIIFTLFRDVLKIKASLKNTWKLKNNQAETLEEMRKQY